MVIIILCLEVRDGLRHTACYTDTILKTDMCTTVAHTPEITRTWQDQQLQHIQSHTLTDSYILPRGALAWCKQTPL